ncbi:MAG: hypothetical protein M3Y24_08545 [Acidobacteriota bacterium]|nr:hypothetical protein [Acidobacteriota bacterium]
MSRVVAVFSALLSTIVFPAVAATPMDYVGQYVLRLGAKNFIVLNLREVQGTLTGSFSRPRRATLGTSFSNIGSEVITESIISAAVQQDHLHLIAKDPKDPSNTEGFDLTLLPPGHASLQATGTPLDPWTPTRVSPSPTLFVATDWDPHHAYYSDETDQSNPDMQRIIDEDQKPRQSADMSHADWATINKQDEDRRRQVRELLAHGALHTGEDFGHAAFVFQHGSTPDDYLLAHTLAMIAMARGNPGALWIATATLDRYLNSIKQPQIYGTQFHNSKETPWTQEPYNRTLISDELRRQLGVPSQAAQQKQLEEYKTANQH